MMKASVLPASAVLVLAVVAVGGGCNFSQSGIAPPANRIFLPAGVVADPDEGFLYVVNSNSDLRFNAGTLVAVDLDKAAAVRAQWTATRPAVCTKTRFSRTEPVSDDYCCRDMLDSNVINCNEPQFIQSDATVQLGSFGGAIELQRYQRGDEVVRRLFVAVRAEPSITFADVTVANGRVSMRCKGPRKDGPAQPEQGFCDDTWRVRRPGGVTPGALVLPEEPYLLAYDDSLKALYVGHLTVSANSQLQGGGVSTLDVCDPQSESSVSFAGLARKAFIPEGLSQAVASISPPDPAQPATRIYATARYSTAISGMVLRAPLHSECGDPQRDDLTLVPADTFYSSAFLPRGADVRGILFSDDQLHAYVLHRNGSDVPANPAALVMLDRRPQADGTPSNAPIDVLEMCSGPTSMKMHDAGRGSRIYVTCYDDGQVYVVDPDGLVVTSAIEVGAGPTSLVFSPNDPGVAYIASFGNSHLSVIDLAPGSPTENHVVMRIGFPHGYGE